MSKQRYKEVERCLGYEFRDKNLIIEALTHKSFKKPYNNERLEFLGDAVLNLIVGEYLYKKFPNSPEGDLSKIRASLVNEQGFTKLAKYINLGDYIYLSDAEIKNEGKDKPSILSDAFEAIMGALYLEAGIEKVRQITLTLLDKNYEEINLTNLFSDYKTALQEITQAKFGVVPEYKLVKESGPDHQKIFEIALIVDDKEYARATGKSKKIAQQSAAKIALEKLSE